jgi:hypothetical protein
MLTLAEIESLERQLKASIVGLNKKKVADVSVPQQAA